jgi:hypothetical protein
MVFESNGPGLEDRSIGHERDNAADQHQSGASGEEGQDDMDSHIVRWLYGTGLAGTDRGAP